MLDAAIFNNDTVLCEYRGDVWRVVESQEDVATSRVVDDLEEQALLESLLDDAKPRYRSGTEGMHYLLKSAFRYPPLPWGSRFGGRNMPSYFYASEQIDTALCECAYYRFMFLQDMQTPYEAAIRSQYTLFNVLLQSNDCLDLTAPEYDSMRDSLSDPASYAATQGIGAWAFERNNSNKNPEQHIGLFRFASARAAKGVNVAVMEPKVIRSPKPKNQQRWLCLTKEDTVSFNSRESDVGYVFKLQDFCDEKGRFLRIV